jgi:hypothetical protein
MEIISKSARKEIIGAMRARYQQASKEEKGMILGEFTAVTGFHRKHAIRLLNAAAEVLVKRAIESTMPSQRIYDEAVKTALIVLWEAADRICGKRLKAAIPTLMGAMERHGHLSLDPEIRKKVVAVSAATIDRVLTPVRQSAGMRRRRHGKKKVSKEIPIKTFSDWKDPAPGFLEIDFVVHGGGSMSGEYLHSFVVTDVCSGWVEAVPLLAREQKLVIEAISVIRGQLPVPLRGIDSDNDGAFINETLTSYCQEAGICFTRSRPHHKNDQAWIEQKNGAVIRKMVGHERLSGIVAGQALAQLLQAVRLYVNYFQPSFKLRERVREGSKVKKLYHPPATPCDRLLAHQDVDAKTKERLRAQRDGLDPLELLQRIRQGQSALAALSVGESSTGPDRESLDKFLGALPELWRLGEARPTHRKEAPKVRHWRTREDPFQNVWTDILLWLQEEPDTTAKTLLERLIDKYPGRYDQKLLRTLQRRVGEWRRTMARELVFAGVSEQTDVKPITAASPMGEAALRLATLASAQPPP